VRTLLCRTEFEKTYFAALIRSFFSLLAYEHPHIGLVLMSLVFYGVRNVFKEKTRERKPLE